MVTGSIPVAGIFFSYFFYFNNFTRNLVEDITDLTLLDRGGSRLKRAMTRIVALVVSLASLARGLVQPSRRVRTVVPHLEAFGLPKFENPFDDRPGCTVGKLQVAE